MDLAKNNPSKAAEVGFEFAVKDPSGMEDDKFKITVRGVMAKEVQAYQRKLFREEQLKDAALRRKGKDPEQKTLEELEEQLAADAARRIITWKGLSDDGKEIPFTLEFAENLFKDSSWAFIRSQVLEASNELTNFRSV
jgi:hypothetical protein